MSDDERRKYDVELEALRAGRKLHPRQAETEFWKVGIALVIATAALVQGANVFFG